MQPECGMGHPRDIHKTGRIIGVISVKAARLVVLSESRAVADRLAQSHMMAIPVRLAGEKTSESVGLRAQRATHEVVRRIPVAEPASAKHVKDRLRVRGCEIPGRAFVVET